MKMNRKILSGFGMVALAMMVSVAGAQVSDETIEALLAEAEAQFNLGNAYYFGEGVAKDLREAVRWYQKAAEQGHAEAQNSLGNAYYFGEGIAKDLHEAVRWYQKAAEQGYAGAQFSLGNAYSFGEGVAKDLREAVRWYQKAAEQGHATAQYSLGVSYSFGEGVAKDLREAVRWYQKAAEQGYADAQYNLGWTYANGEGIAKDLHEAVQWYQKAAEQGHATAQFNLGNAYNFGKGIAKDLREAARWYQKAAEQGHAKAQHNLSLAYWHGKGITKDPREAVRWYRKAAEQGVARAQYNLGVAYWNGEGVITDKYEAYIWYSIAKANGDENAAKSLHKLKWHDYLSQSEIRSANKEAAERLAAIENRETKPAEGSAVGANIAIAAAPNTVSPAEKVFENAWRSVVMITNGNGQGSGVIIRPNIVATNCHVVDGVGGIVVYQSVGRRVNTDSGLPATIRRRDEYQDFCLLDVAGLWGVPATVRRYDSIKVGEAVYGLGAPRGFDLSLSAGLVSQLRTIDGIRYVQTDAAISPGSSGGGLFDGEGSLIGIMTFKIAGASTEGIGFAIAADLAWE